MPFSNDLTSKSNTDELMFSWINIDFPEMSIISILLIDGPAIVTIVWTGFGYNLKWLMPTSLTFK